MEMGSEGWLTTQLISSLPAGGDTHTDQLTDLLTDTYRSVEGDPPGSSHGREAQKDAFYIYIYIKVFSDFIEQREDERGEGWSSMPDLNLCRLGV